MMLCQPHEEKKKREKTKGKFRFQSFNIEVQARLSHLVRSDFWVGPNLHWCSKTVPTVSRRSEHWWLKLPTSNEPHLDPYDIGTSCQLLILFCCQMPPNYGR